MEPLVIVMERPAEDTQGDTKQEKGRGEADAKQEKGREEADAKQEKEYTDVPYAGPDSVYFVNRRDKTKSSIVVLDPEPGRAGEVSQSR